MTRHRLAYLDGLRGVAIALVVLFHAYARWPGLVGNEYAHTALAQGNMGVQLFFLISGFVIFMSLEKSTGAFDFLRRRWLRLFPAMAVASLLVFVTSAWFERPAGQPRWIDLLPGLTFVGPGWWAMINGPSQGVLEGSFWSLFVEVKFYVVAGMAYFWFGARGAIGVLLAVFTVSLLGFGRALNAEYWGWFAAGALHYKFAATGKRLLFLAAVAVSLLSAMQVDRAFQPAAICMALLFAAAELVAWVRRLLETRVLLFLGFVSYPLYLLHENMMIGMMVRLRRFAPALPQLVLPVLPVTAVIALAWLVAVYAEPPLRRRLDVATGRLQWRSSGPSRHA